VIQIFVVDDHESFLRFVSFALVQEGYHVKPMTRGAQLMDALQDSAQVDLVLLDRFLPDADGFELCETLRESMPQLPIIMFSTAGDAQDVVKGLRTGADDYLPKPFPPEVLIAKVQAVLRRTRHDQEPKSVTVEVGPLTIEPLKKMAYLEGTPLSLTKSEFRILSALAERQGEVWDRIELLSEAFDYPEHADYLTSNLGFHISALRKKFGRYRDMIVTVRGFGYKLVVPHTKNDRTSGGSGV